MSSTQTFVYIGNAANIFVLGASIVYAATVIYFTQPGKSGVLDEAWKKDGFCIHNKDVRYASSFDTCPYVDVLVLVTRKCFLSIKNYSNFKMQYS